MESEIVAKVKELIGDPKDKCYYASEALYYLLGGKEAGYKPMVAKYQEGEPRQKRTHWWLQRKDGSVLDITETQFGFGFPHSLGKGCGFLTKQPSKRAQEIIDAYNSEQPQSHEK